MWAPWPGLYCYVPLELCNDCFMNTICWLCSSTTTKRVWFSPELMCESTSATDVCPFMCTMNTSVTLSESAKKCMSTTSGPMCDPRHWTTSTATTGSGGETQFNLLHFRGGQGKIKFNVNNTNWGFRRKKFEKKNPQTTSSKEKIVFESPF